MKPTIEIKNFTKYYGDFKAVDMKYLSVYPGEILALLGPNGAGKTTTLETLEGLREASSGELTLKGLNVRTDYHKIRKLIGVQLQSQSLPPSITIKEAMELFCGYYQVKPRVDLLERFGLKEIENRQFGNLSVGQQRKLALAIAMAHEPEILILDEPTAGLDVNIKAELHEVLKELRNKGCSIILSSHDMFEIEKLADRIAILLKGEIITIATPTEIKNTYNLIKINVKTEKSTLLNGFSSEFLINPINNQEYIEFYIDIKNVHQLLNEIMGYLDEHHDEIVDINIEKSSLEERFIALTNKLEEGAE
ncbi:ABC transporter ATP-binding protein [Mycoplasmatota bacterium]|nr:ABC transporter ATP-binding protein [Mycoplasmatota bacterium]